MHRCYHWYHVGITIGAILIGGLPSNEDDVLSVRAFSNCGIVAVCFVTVGVIAIIDKRVGQKILADATIMAAQPPETNQPVLESTIKCDTMIMRTATARVPAP